MTHVNFFTTRPSRHLESHSCLAGCRWPTGRRAPLLSRSRGALTSHARTTPPRTHRADGYAPTIRVFCAAISCVARLSIALLTLHRQTSFASHRRVERDRQEFCKVIRTGHSLVIRRRKIAQASIAARNMDDGATIHNVWHQLLRETDGSNVIDSLWIRSTRAHPTDQYTRRHC